MNDQEQRIKALEAEIKSLKAEMDLHWEVDLKKQQEIEKLQQQRHQEVIDRQDKNIFWQKVMGLGTILTAIILLLDKILTLISKSKRVVKETKKIFKKDKK